MKHFLYPEDILFFIVVTFLCPSFSIGIGGVDKCRVIILTKVSGLMKNRFNNHRSSGFSEGTFLPLAFTSSELCCKYYLFLRVP